MPALGFAIDLDLAMRGMAAPPPPQAPVSAFTVLGPSDLDPDGGGVGVNGNGWVVFIRTPFIAGASLDPKKFQLTVQDPGYSAARVPATQTRFIQGGKVLRRQYANHAQLQAGQNGANFEAWFSIEDPVYAGSTIVGVQCAAGWYGAAAEGAVPAGAIGNTSTRGYPKPLAVWLNRPYERCAGASFRAELYASHLHGRNGRMVAGVSFTGSDGTNSTAVIDANAPALATVQTQGNIVECFPVDCPTAGLSQGVQCTLDAEIFPWIGDAGAVLKLSTSGQAMPTARPQVPLIFLNDRTGGYGGAVACVKTGAAGGTVQADIATARTTPFPDMLAACTAIAAWNSANKGHNDLGAAQVYFLEDGPGLGATHTFGGNIAQAAGLAWCEFLKDPAATGQVTLNLAATRTVPSLTSWGVRIAHSAGNGIAATTNKFIAYDGADIVTTMANVPITYQAKWAWFRNTTASYTTAGGCPFQPFNNAGLAQVALALGCVFEGSAVNANMLSVFAALGNRFTRMQFGELDPAVYTNAEDMSRAVFANNWWRDCRVANVFGLTRAFDTGLHIVQNVVERAQSVGAVPALQLFADGSTKTCDNVLVAHNTVPGERVNYDYGDVAGAVDIQRTIVTRFNLWDQGNTKSDTFTTNTVLTGRIGNWQTLYRVGSRGDVWLRGTTNGDTVPGTGVPPSGNWLGEYWPQPSYNVTRAAVTFANMQANIPETSTNGAGLGGYGLTGAANAAYDRVAVGLAMLSRDIAGTARRNNGTGAAGAYERTVG